MIVLPPAMGWNEWLRAQHHNNNGLERLLFRLNLERFKKQAKNACANFVAFEYVSGNSNNSNKHCLAWDHTKT